MKEKNKLHVLYVSKIIFLWYKYLLLWSEDYINSSMGMDVRVMWWL